MSSRDRQAPHPPLRRPRLIPKAWSADSVGRPEHRRFRAEPASGGGGGGHSRPLIRIPGLLLFAVVVWLLWTVCTVIVPQELALMEAAAHRRPDYVDPPGTSEGLHRLVQLRLATRTPHAPPAPERASPSQPPPLNRAAAAALDARLLADARRAAMADYRLHGASAGRQQAAAPAPPQPVPGNATLLLLENRTWELPGAQDPIQCVAWRQTGDCRPDGPREPHNDKACNETIPSGSSGYCEVVDRREDPDGKVSTLMELHCDSYPAAFVSKGDLSCGTAWEFASFPERSLTFRPSPSLQLQPDLLDVQMSAERGIVFCVAESLMVSAYAAIKVLRSKGCELPVELWYFPDELKHSSERVVARLVKSHGVSMRPVQVPREKLCHEKGKGKCFNIKIHAVYHTNFAQVLLLDTDNFAFRDPTYLFDSKEFLDTGAMFWPDFWSPHNTIFNVWNTSIVWELTGVPFVDMFEQESGQLLIDRQRHTKALDVLMFYAVPDNILYRYGPVYGDKDLFRLAWMRADEPFHMIKHPPGWAGQLKDLVGFCGNTMVQHGPEGDILFLHRNGYKLDVQAKSRRRIWQGLKEWAGGDNMTYWTDTWTAKRRWGFLVNPCYGPQKAKLGYAQITGPLFNALEDLEDSILSYGDEAVALYT